jgi:3',5'-nucleoside bisphosphate phosphatase
MPRADLHVHTNSSDGRYAPADLVALAARADVSILGITDHDTVGGLEAAIEAARAFPQMTVVPGVEINTDVASGEAHVLGYFIDYGNAELLSLLAEMRASRHDRAQKMLSKLAALGMPLEWERVKEIASTDSIGRPHVAQAMMEKGYISTLRDAFDRYIGFGGPAYVERAKLSPADAVELILRADGIPVLAHPLTVGEPEKMISDLKDHGLAGIEVYYGCYSRSQVTHLRSFAQRYSLLPTGGSDYHGLDEAAETGLGKSGLPLKAARALIALSEKNAATKAKAFGAIR